MASATRRSSASNKANVSSATATAFLPGQFATQIPRSLAASTSIVLTPAPARMTRAMRPFSSIGRVTFVERTMSTEASLRSITFMGCVLAGDACYLESTNQAQFALDNLDVRVVPEPGSLALFGLGLALMAGAGRRRITR